jgi:hypothetical protein
LLILEEANVFLVYVNINEAPDGPAFIQEAFLDAGVTALEFGDHVADGAGADLDQFFVIGQLPQGSWDSYIFGHKLQAWFRRAGRRHGAWAGVESGIEQ